MGGRHKSCHFLKRFTRQCTRVPDLDTLGEEEQLEHAESDLTRIQNTLMELSGKDPDFYGGLVLTASRLRRARKEIEELLFRYRRRPTKWYDE